MSFCHYRHFLSSSPFGYSENSANRFEESRGKAFTPRKVIDRRFLRRSFAEMPRFKDEPPAVRVYTVCDESRYLIVRNVPALGCGDELRALFANFGDVEECKPMDAEECEEYTDVYWIKFRLVSNARFAKKKLDEDVFLGNRLNVSYAPQFETVSDTKEKLECRRREVLGRSNSNSNLHSNLGRTKLSLVRNSGCLEASSSQANVPRINNAHRDHGGQELAPHLHRAPVTRVSSDKEYFPSQSMNQTVRSVREKLNKIESSGDRTQHGSAAKKSRLDNRRRI